MSLDALLATCVAELDNSNTVAIGLTGSHTRGQAQRYSDVDLWHFVQTVPDEPFISYTLRQEGDYLVSITVSTLSSQRAKMNQPDGALSAVPGLRQTRILLDKTGELGALVQAANDFEWSSVQAEADRYASYDLMGNAEEAHKIMNGLVQADDYLLVYGVIGLVIGLARTVALRNGVLSESENTYWRDVQASVGMESQWAREQRLALGLVLASPRMRGMAGLRLYRETAKLLQPIILPEHEPVIASTLKRLAHFVG